MGMQSFLNFLMGHNTAIVGLLFVGIVVVGMSYFIWSYFKEDVTGNKESSKSSSENLEKIEETLRKILEQSGKVSSTVVAAEAVDIDSAIEGLATAVAQGDGLSSEELTKLKEQFLQSEEAKKVFESEVSKLKKDVVNRDIEIEKLKKQDQSLSGPNKALESKLRELEEKLQEYEIIEDDIADLSLYKEENSRLREELAKFKGGETSQSNSELEFDSDVVETENEGDDDGLINEFKEALENDQEVFVAEEDKAEFEDLLVAEPSVVAAAEPSFEEKASPKQKQVKFVEDDILGELIADEYSEDELETEGNFSAIDSNKNLFDANDKKEIDTDRMLSELGDLEGLKSEGSALEEELDVDKMAAEATSLTSKD